ncbi:uncharacterized protein LOC130910956 [Corythoichthys intestinalis]|uniref:uncharacterized protein LOC130910956 n=1 Tax=Corythoichthys intestinalis TaxID=161448 RepID=UPI0025A4F44A|nr:uncharacterized protein LOC130910956 [Corythoichthys intestinalis]
MGRILVGIISAVACLVLVESLTCNQCSFGLVGLCLSSSTVECATNTSQCFTGKATFPSVSTSVGFNTQGCIEESACNKTTNSSLIGVPFETEVTCCSTDQCNPVQLSGASATKTTLATAVGVALTALAWGSLLSPLARSYDIVVSVNGDLRITMNNIWKTVILLATIVAAAHCLTCRRCVVGLFDLCLFGSDEITCNNATQSCFHGSAQFNATASVSLQVRGCLDTDLCGDVLTGSLFGIGYTASFECCNTDLCNSATSFQFSLMMAVCAAIFSLQAM